MSTKLKAGTSTSGAVIDADTTGILELQSGSTPTTAITVDASQNVTYSAGFSGGTGVVNLGSGQFYKDASGNVGIGQSTPTVNLDVKNSSGNCIISAQYGTGTKGQIISANNEVQIKAFNGTNDVLTFTTGSTERSRIDSNGNYLVGTGSTLVSSTTPTIQLLGTGSNHFVIRNSAATAGLLWRYTTDSNNTLYIVNQATTGVYIATGGTSWTGISDERLKTDLKPIENGIEKVNSLRAVTGRFKTDEIGKSRSFLIAQDVQAVLPEAVSVGKDEMLGIQYTEVIPLLVSAIKELKAELDATKAEVVALKGAK